MQPKYQIKNLDDYWLKDLLEDVTAVIIKKFPDICDRIDFLTESGITSLIENENVNENGFPQMLYLACVAVYRGY